MIAKEKPLGWYVQGFRRYRPENRVNRGMVTAAPWVSVTLLIIGYLYLSLPNVLQPGVMVQLPSSRIAAGSKYGLNVVIVSRESMDKSGRKEIVYFEDDRFLVQQPVQMDDLGRRLAKAAHERGDVPLVIEADATVKHGTVILLFDLAAAAGIKEVNVATLPAE